MNGETEHELARTLRLEAIEKEFELLHRLIFKAKDPSGKREALLSYCNERSVEEWEIWWKLAMFRESGAEGLLYESPPDFSFDSPRSNRRQQILERIWSIPLEALGDFRELIVFTSMFLDRVQFLCDFLLSLFLERESGFYRKSKDMSGYTDFFVQKMFQEIDKIDEITYLNLFDDLNYLYDQWLSDESADEEVLI